MVYKRVHYQFQQPSGSWQTVRNGTNVSEVQLKLELDSLQKTYRMVQGGLRVRAVDGQSGSLIDLR